MDDNLATPLGPRSRWWLYQASTWVGVVVIAVETGSISLTAISISAALAQMAAANTRVTASEKRQRKKAVQ